MEKKDLLEKLLVTFKAEADERVRSISSGLVELEKAITPESRRPGVEKIFREVHSLKGAARVVNLVEVETICQALEEVFSVFKRNEPAMSPGLFDKLHRACDHLSMLCVTLATAHTPAERAPVEEIVDELRGVLEDHPRPSSQRQKVQETKRQIPFTRGLDSSVGKEGNTPGDTVRITTAKLDSILLQAEELLPATLRTRQRIAELREITAAFATRQREWARVLPAAKARQREMEKAGGGPGPSKQAREQRAVFEFLEWDNTFIRSLESRFASLTKSVEHDHRFLGQITDRLLEDMKKVLMLPFNSLLELFPKLVRDLSRNQGKEVDLVIQGGETEIDRRILEEMKDPLIHLVRNSIDHGIETPKDREQKRKVPRGRVVLAVTQKNGNQVEIRLSDDGIGIDLAKVRAAVTKLGAVPREEVAKLDEQEMLSLIFSSGISTSPMVTDISGRGLGLAIVREKVERLGGVVSVETTPDHGTAFRIVLPTTFTTYRGLLVSAEEQLFIIPVTNVERVLRVVQADILTVEGRETIQFGGKAIALVRLADVLLLPGGRAKNGPQERVQVVLLQMAERRIAFVVDEVLSEQEVLAKGLGRQLSRIRNIAGAVILGTGQVVPILNVSDLLSSATLSAAFTRDVATAPLPVGEMKKKTVLVVEDSITARMLLKNILEAAGYIVKTAVDGMDGLTAARAGHFDLVVSDVEMPRMNGFDLTAKLRADKRLSELPVVLVTALQSREDRERGIDVGANAYLVKSSFDQSNLLDVVKRLI